MVHQSNNLPQVKQDKLRKFLDDEALNTLFEVLESKAFEYEVEAANALLEMRAGYDAKAKEAVSIANSIHFAIVLLKEIRLQKTFTTSSAKPNTKPTTKTI
jgi:hypothetical protein